MSKSEVLRIAIGVVLMVGGFAFGYWMINKTYPANQLEVFLGTIVMLVGVVVGGRMIARVWLDNSNAV